MKPMKHASIFIHKKIQEKIRIIHRNNRWDRTQVINTPTRRDKTHLHNSLQKKIKNRTLLKKKLLNLFMVYIFVVIHQCPSFTINNKHALSITMYHQKRQFGVFLTCRKWKYAWYLRMSGSYICMCVNCFTGKKILALCYFTFPNVRFICLTKKCYNCDFVSIK